MRVPDALIRCVAVPSPPPPAHATMAPPEPSETITGTLLFALVESGICDHSGVPTGLIRRMRTPPALVANVTNAPPAPSDSTAGSVSLNVFAFAIGRPPEGHNVAPAAFTFWPSTSDVPPAPVSSRHATIAPPEPPTSAPIASSRAVVLVDSVTPSVPQPSVPDASTCWARGCVPAPPNATNAPPAPSAAITGSFRSPVVASGMPPLAHWGTPPAVMRCT